MAQLDPDFAAHAAAFTGSVPTVRAFDMPSLSSTSTGSDVGSIRDTSTLVSRGGYNNPPAAATAYNGVSNVAATNSFNPLHGDMVPLSASAPVGRPVSGNPYLTGAPSVTAFDPARGVCSLVVTVEKAAEGGFGFTLSQFSLYEAQKNTAKSINLQPLARKCYYAPEGGLPVVDILPHGAAAGSGIRQWDVIVEIDSVSICGLTAREAIDKLRDKNQVELKVVRLGPPPSDPMSVTSGSLYGSMVASPFVSFQPPLEKIKNDDGTFKIKFLLKKKDQGGWGFTPFKFSISEMKKLTSWHQTLRRGEWDVAALRKKCKFAKKVGGLPVQYVRHGGAAHSAGMASWDVILDVNGRDVREDTAEEITEMFKTCPTETTVTVLRSPNPPPPIKLSSDSPGSPGKQYYR